MVFQTPKPFPKSVYDNVVHGPCIHGMAPTRADLDEIVTTSPKKAGLWEEASDQLDASGRSFTSPRDERPQGYITGRFG